MAAPNNKLFPQAENAKGALPAWFEQHQPRMADSIPSAPGFSGISAPSLSESSGRVQPTVAPDTSRSATTSTSFYSGGSMPGYPPPPPGPMQDPRRAANPQAVSNALPRKNPADVSGMSGTPYATEAKSYKPPSGTGGSGFVGFEQYFGANQPSAQRMAQQQAQGISAGIKEQANKRAAGGSSSDYAQAADTARSGAQSGFKDFAGGDMTNAQPQQAGSAGSFNAMLGGRANKAAAAEEQKGLNALANYFGQQQANAAWLEQDAASRAMQQEAEAGTAEEQQRHDEAYRLLQDWLDRNRYNEQPPEQAGYEPEYDQPDEDYGY